MKVTVKQDRDTSESYVDLSEVLKGTNIKPEDVAYYNIETKGKAIAITFFDKNKKQMEVK